MFMIRPFVIISEMPVNVGIFFEGNLFWESFSAAFIAVIAKNIDS